MSIITDVVLPLSLAFIMYSLGLGLAARDFARILAMPRAVLVGALAQVALLPATAFALLHLFPLPPELSVGVMILSLAPGGVTSNLLTRFAGGSVALSVTLTGLISLLSVLSVPVLTAASIGYFMDTGAPQVNVGALAIAMFAITTVPVALGVLTRALLPRLTARIERPAAIAAAALFALILVGALAANWGLFIANIAILGPLLVLLNVAMLAIGLLLGRLAALPRGEATAIAIESGIQNGTLGIAVGALIVGGSTGISAFSLPSGVYGITMYAVSLPVIAVLRRWNRTAP